jgi:aspartate ammonia-lyase
MRVERDYLGEMLLPEDVYYGIQTERSRQNFDVSQHTIGDFPRYITCIAFVKKAAALTNADIGQIPRDISEAICEAANEVIAGKIAANFPVDVYNAVGGVSVNMNMNEVLANRANEIITGHKGYDVVHPNNHVNANQSTSDAIITAIQLTLHLEIMDLIEALRNFKAIMDAKIEEFKDVVKISRTCLQEAVPITVYQEFSAYLAGITRGITQLTNVANNCLDLPLGATVVGTGLGLRAGYMENIYPYLEQVTGLKVRRHPNFFDALQNGDIFQSISSAFKSLATFLGKMASDLRMLSSGYHSKTPEIILPPVQPGSSFMPGKINPTMPEFIKQIAYQICGNDLVVTMAVEGGDLDLNVWDSIIAKNLFESCQLLKNSIPLFAEKCVKGIQVNRETCEQELQNSLGLSSIVALIYGYQAGNKVAKYAEENNLSIKQAAIALKIMTESLAEELFDPLTLTDVTKSVRMIDLVIEEQRAKTQQLIGGVDLNNRQKILDLMIKMAWEDGKITSEEALAIEVVSDALQLDLKHEEVKEGLKTCPVIPLEGIDGMSARDRERLYICGAWLALMYQEEAADKSKLLAELGMILKIDEHKAKELRDNIIKVRQEKPEFMPQSEEYNCLNEFEQLLSRFQ